MFKTLLSVASLGVSIFFTYGTYNSLPKNGCYQVTTNGPEICSDFQSFELISVFYFSVALLFAILPCLILFRKVCIRHRARYSAKDLVNNENWELH